VKIDGKELLITPASFDDAMSLKKAIFDALRGNGINVDTSGLNSDDPLHSDIGPDTLGNLIENAMAVASDPQVERCLFTCCESVAFGPKRDKVNKDFFEDTDNRQYYYPIMIEVIKANIGPFLKGLGLLLGIRGGLKELFQNVKSPQMNE
jgi:hypothetical protein